MDWSLTIILLVDTILFRIGMVRIDYLADDEFLRWNVLQRWSPP